jgi:mRNA interferase RelE/StbE
LEAESPGTFVAGATVRAKRCEVRDSAGLAGAIFCDRVDTDEDDHLLGFGRQAARRSTGGRIRAVTRALHDYATTGAGDVKKLSGRESYRLRVGRYRVVFDEDTVTVMAIYVGKRETTTYRKK